LLGEGFFVTILLSQAQTLVFDDRWQTRCSCGNSISLA
jgi:hypothetical protein